MISYYRLLILIPLLVILYQIYSFTSSRTGEEKQTRCRKLGIGYMVLGILAMVEREPLAAFFGLILIMLAFRLMAKSLDRIDKTVFIDRYGNDK